MLTESMKVRGGFEMNQTSADFKTIEFIAFNCYTHTERGANANRGILYDRLVDLEM